MNEELIRLETELLLLEERIDALLARSRMPRGLARVPIPPATVVEAVESSPLFEEARAVIGRVRAIISRLKKSMGHQ